MEREKLEDLNREIEAIARAANRLKELSGGIQAVERNAARILASVKMLKIEVSDLLEVA